MTRPNLLDRIATLADDCARARNVRSARLLVAAAQLVEARWATTVARTWISKQIQLLPLQTISSPCDIQVVELLHETLSCLETMAAEPGRMPGSCEFCLATGGGCIVCGYQE